MTAKTPIDNIRLTAPPSVNTNRPVLSIAKASPAGLTCIASQPGDAWQRQMVRTVKSGYSWHTASTFSDTGDGLPEEVQVHLFEAFVSSRKDGGTGLGLAIVKKIVDDHKGHISVSTRRGEGTTFTVAIPLSRE